MGPDGELHDVRLSKLLSKLLRHEARRAKVDIDANGWIAMSDVIHYINHGPAADSEKEAWDVWKKIWKKDEGKSTSYTEDEVRLPRD